MRSQCWLRWAKRATPPRLGAPPARELLAACDEISGDVYEDELTDAYLFRRIRRGDRGAFGILARRYDQDLRRLATRLLAEPDQVDPVMTLAYAKAWRSRGLAHMGRSTGSSRGSPEADWLYRVVYNTCIDELRKRPQGRGRNRPDGPRVPLPKASTERRLHGLRALRVAERIPLVLIDGEGFGVDAASRILQRDPTDVARDLQRARRRWRDVVVGGDMPVSSPATTRRPAETADPAASESEPSEEESNDHAGVQESWP